MTAPIVPLTLDDVSMVQWMHRVSVPSSYKGHPKWGLLVPFAHLKLPGHSLIRKLLLMIPTQPVSYLNGNVLKAMNRSSLYFYSSGSSLSSKAMPLDCLALFSRGFKIDLPFMATA